MPKRIDPMVKERCTRRVSPSPGGKGSAQSRSQMPHPRRRHGQRAARLGRRLKPEIELVLPARERLASNGLKQLELDVIVSGPDVLDISGTPAVRYTI